MNNSIKSLVLALAVVTVAAPVIALAQPGDQGPRNLGTTLETHIYNDGTVLVRGAKVTAVSSSTISATQTWGSSVLNWTVNASGVREVVMRGDENANISQIKIGDYVSFKGMIDATGAQFTVNATIIKDWSLQQTQALLEKRIFEGTLKSVNGTAVPASIIATVGNTDYTVNISSTTTILNTLWSPIGFSQLKVGDHIRIYGAVEANNMTVIDAYVVRDTSIR